MKPSIVSLTITFVKDQTTDDPIMEIMALLSDGHVIQKSEPVNGRIIRLDADYFYSPPQAVSEEDGA